MAKKKKTLPKDFKEILKKNNLEEIKTVFETTDINAVGGYEKTTALGFSEISESAIRWLVAQGADLEATDAYGRTAVFHQVYSEVIAVLIDLGVDIHTTDNEGNTPLHFAVDAGRAFAVEQLLKADVEIKAQNNRGETPLEYALHRADNRDIPVLATISEIFLTKGSPITKSAQEAVTRIGKGFEAARDIFNPDSLEETDAALHKLYRLFKVEPVEKKKTHNGASKIVVSTKNVESQFEELWELLVPASGSAKTVQGEMIRITGRIRDEIYRNGGVNWDKEYQKMGLAFVQHLSEQKPLGTENIKKAHAMIKALNRDTDIDDLDYLCQMAVQWVLQNPDPIPLSGTAYKR